MLDKQFAEAVMPTGGFSAKAIERFDVFIEEGGFTVDRKKVEPELFFWLLPLYRITRTDVMGLWIKRNGKRICVKRPRFEAGIYLRKASQMGATVFSVLFMLWLCIDEQHPLGVVCFWPTEKDLIDFVQMRFDPLIKTSEKMQTYLGSGQVDNTRAKQIGKSSLFLRYIKGEAGLDSIPVDVVIFDEVRLYEDAQKIAERADYRLAQSDVKLRIYMSTVGSPGDFMETGWEKSNRMKYFSVCPSGCVTIPMLKPDVPGMIVDNAELAPRHLGTEGASSMVIPGVVLSDYDPPAFVRRATRWERVEGGDTEMEVDDTHYVCPHCRARIDDPSQGAYFEVNPGPARPYAIEFGATLSVRTTPLVVITKFETSKDRKEFFNNILAKPYRDPEGSIVKPEHILAARSDSRVKWYLSAAPGMETFLGADFRTEEIHVIVLSTLR